MSIMSIRDDYAKRDLLDYLQHQKYHKLIGIDLSRQKHLSISEQTNFTGKLEEHDHAAMFFIGKKQQRTILNVSLALLKVIE